MVAKLNTFGSESIPRGSSEITDVVYDIWSLRVTLDIKEHRGVVYIEFDSPIGFRVLDEGELSDFWKDAADSPYHCIHEVVSGGWFDLENTREDFLAQSENCIEYMISGVNYCVSVIAHEPPKIQVITI